MLCECMNVIKRARISILAGRQSLKFVWIGTWDSGFGNTFITMEQRHNCLMAIVSLYIFIQASRANDFPSLLVANATMGIY